MSRIELHCPSCGYDVPMTLLPPPKMFECPECQEVMPRDKLTRLKVLHRHIAGAPASTAMFAVGPLGSGNLFDAAAATNSLTITNCVFQAGDIAVVCVAGFNNGSSAPSSVTVGGAGMVGDATSASDPEVDIFSRANTTAGSKSVVVTWGSNPTAAAAVVLSLRRGKTSSHTDQSAGNAGTGPAYDTTATSALAVVGELAVACVGFLDTDGVAAPSFPQGYTRLGRAGTHGGAPGDVCIDVAWNLRTSLGAVQVTGLLATAVNYGTCVMTYKPL